jgi:two-component system response regulator BasR
MIVCSAPSVDEVDRNEERLSQQDESAAAGGNRCKPRVLVVEDEVAERAALAKALVRAGFDAECAASAGEALAMVLTSARPSAALIDLKLPDASGGLILWRLRRSYGKDVAIGVVTGLHNPLAHPDLVRDPPDKLFPKPVDAAEIIEWLRTVTRSAPVTAR